MQLLVSVASAADAREALAGGADVIDAKDPTAGALGAVAPATLSEINATVAGSRALTAAVGDAADEGAVERAAHDAAAGGAALVKIGFAGVRGARRAARLAAAAVRGARAGRDGSGVILVGYADAERAGSLRLDALVGVAAEAGARGALVDTALKDGPGLLALVASGALETWVAEARAAALIVALAGKLTAADFPAVRALAPDVVGVRGAACDGGRVGRVSASKVRSLRALCAAPGGTLSAATAPAPLRASPQQ